MRFLHLSDLHFGRSLCEYSLLPDQEHWCRGLLRHLEAERYDAVLIAGDLYDRAVPSGDAVALCDWFLGELAGRLSLPVLCIAGNHDSPQRLSFASSLYRAGGLYMAAIPRRELCRVTLGDQWGEVDFFLLPYLTPGDGRGLFPTIMMVSGKTGGFWSAAPGRCCWPTASSDGGRRGRIWSFSPAIRR